MHQIENESSSDDDNLFVDTIMTVNSIHGQTNWTQHAKINSKTITSKIDIGAMCNVMSFETYKSLCFPGKLDKKSTKLKSYTGHQLTVKGTRNIQCNVNGQNYNVKFYIVELESETLLGGESAEQMKLIKRVLSKSR